MTQPSAPHISSHSPDRGELHLPHGVRRLAEWVSFGVSAAIVLGLAGYLIYDGLRDGGPVVPVEVSVAFDRATMADERHVVPIRVRNMGVRTLTKVKVEVTHRGRDGSTQTDDFEIDYLPEASHETLYFYLDLPPRDANITAEATQYRLE